MLQRRVRQRRVQRQRRDAGGGPAQQRGAVGAVGESAAEGEEAVGQSHHGSTCEGAARLLLTRQWVGPGVLERVPRD